MFKDQGNASTRKKFDEAVGFFEQAIAALPDEITYFNNLAAVKFEQKDYHGCVAKARRGSRRARGARRLQAAAKAFARIGNATRRRGSSPRRSVRTRTL